MLCDFIFYVIIQPNLALSQCRQAKGKACSKELSLFFNPSLRVTGGSSLTEIKRPKSVLIFSNHLQKQTNSLRERISCQATSEDLLNQGSRMSVLLKWLRVCQPLIVHRPAMVPLPAVHRPLLVCCPVKPATARSGGGSKGGWYEYFKKQYKED